MCHTLHFHSALPYSPLTMVKDVRFRVDIPDDLVASSKDDTPFVVVCGWFGSRDKNVKKYTQEFNRLGCGTLRTIMPDALVFSPFNGGREAYARDLLHAVRSARREHGMSGGPLYLMFMSNGGCWLHVAMTRTGMLSPTGEFSDLDKAVSERGGIVFDSSPVFMSMASCAKAISLGMSPMSPIRCAIVMCLLYVAAAVIALGSFLTTGGLEAVPPRVFWKNVRLAPGGRRELYLFSDADQVCDAHKVAELIEERRQDTARDCRITEVRWKDSRHCAHLIDKREEYVAALTTFLKQS